MKIDINKIKGQIVKRQKLVFISGVLCLLYGLVRFIFFNPRVGINLKTQLPSILNGTVAIFLGIGLLVGWYLTKKNKKNIIEREIEEIKEKRKPDKEYR